MRSPLPRPSSFPPNLKGTLVRPKVLPRSAGFTLASHSRETTARFMGISLRELRAKLGLLAVGLQGFQFIQDRLDYDILPNRTRRRQME